MSINESNNDSIINYIFWSCFIYVSWKILNKLWTLSDQYLLPYFRKPIDFKYYGQWAVITGSTDGIGKGFAEELAAKGLDICLISRNEEKLINTAKYIEERYNVNTKYIVADFTDPNIYTHIGENLKDLDIGVLVNNVGMIHGDGQPYSEHTGKLIKNYLNVNILSAMMMTSIILPCMIAKKKGLIVNISSVLGELESGSVTVYASSKACINKFGQNLSYELKKYNIEVKTLTPGQVLTPMGNLYPRLTKLSSLVPVINAMPTANNYVRSILNQSLNSKSVQSCGYIGHELFLTGSNMLPAPLTKKITEIIFSPKSANG